MTSRQLKPTSVPVYGDGVEARQRQLRIRDDGRVHVARHVDLGNDDDVAARRVLDELRVVMLRIEATRTAAHGARAADLREPRPRLDLDPPALVVGEVEVQAVEAEAGDDVDEALHVLDAEEVPRDVEHHAAPLEARHALTAPAVSPNEILRCTSRKKTTTGIAINVDPAISAPKSVCLLLPRKYDSQTVTVCFD